MEEKRISELILLQKVLHYNFTDLKLLNKALTHTSYANEANPPVKNNERLEFLGDSVLDLIVSSYTIHEYEDLPEGSLSKIRAAVVNESCLAKLAQGIDLGSYLLLGKGEHRSGGRKKPSILANAYEALVGSIFYDSNYQTTYNIFLPAMVEEIYKYKNACVSRDFKSDLQEYTQNRFTCTPTYHVVGEKGPSHDKRFDVKVYVRDKILGKGNGRSKKEAEQIAAKIALESFLSNEK